MLGISEKVRELTETVDTDRAVSPVIGVILMVAITVILAAVIGTFVLGLGSQVGSTPTAGVSQDVTEVDSGYMVEFSWTSKGNVKEVVIQAPTSGSSYSWNNISANAETKKVDGAGSDAPDLVLTSVGADGQSAAEADGTEFNIYGMMDGSAKLIRSYTIDES